MLRILLAFVMGLGLVQYGWAETELKGTPEELGKYLNEVSQPVMITGRSEIKITADTANVRMMVTTESKTLYEALKKNQSMREAMLRELKKSGISADKMMTSKFSSTPQFGLFDSKKPASYKVENLVKITVTSDEEFQQVAKLVDSNKEVEYEGMEYEQSEKDTLKQKALLQACDNVIKKKEMYEELFGLKLEVRSITAADVITQNATVQNSPRRYDKLAVNSSRYIVTEKDSLFGEFTFTGQVTVEFLVNTK